MKELEFLKIINKTLTKNSHLGDDCAYLEDLDIVVTHDSLVEDIHFSQKYSTPFQIGYKTIIVNISDIFASGAVPKYFTISISLPPDTNNKFIEDFYKACEDLSKKFNFEIIGGDITGGEKVFISACAIGITQGRKISSRRNAKTGDYVITTGVHGSSAAGLWLLQNPDKITEYKSLTNTHLFPNLNENLSREIATKAMEDYAMMDTSDGLADALFKIAQASNVSISIDFDKIPYDKDIEKVANIANVDFKDWIFYGGEDYQLVACVNKKTLDNLDSSTYTIIGKVTEQDKNALVSVKSNNNIQTITLTKTYNHFKEDKQ